MDELPPSARGDLPNAKWLQFLSSVMMVGFMAVTAWVFAYSQDAQTKGILVGAWIAMVSKVDQFWLGSSSGGKRK